MLNSFVKKKKEEVQYPEEFIDGDTARVLQVAKTNPEIRDMMGIISQDKHARQRNTDCLFL